MSNLIIYDAERDAGLTDQILASATLELIGQPHKIVYDQNYDVKKLLGPSELKIIATNLGQLDLHYLNTILVSVGWNANDDVFLKEEVYAARHTPEDKPFNYEHQESDIIGHITGSQVIDDSGVVLADDLSNDDLPDSFHIKTSAVIYKHWEDEAKAARIEEIIKEIAEDKWFVSMECLMTNFDYALRDKNTKAEKIVARTQETAFLTKHLRRYKGTGTYENFEVGRILRQIAFSGKGLVRKPANAKSVILTSTAHTLFNGVQANLQTENDIMAEQTIQELSKEIANLNKEIVKANTERDEAKAVVAQVNSEQTAVKIQSLEGAVKARDEKITELTSKATQVQADLDAAVKAKEDVVKAQAELDAKLAAATAKIAELEGQAKAQSRVAAFVEAGYTKELAESTVKSLAALSDEQFAAVAVVAKSAKPTDKKDGEADAAKAADEKEKKDNDKEEKAEAALNAATAEKDVNLGGDAPTQKVLAAKLADDLGNLFKSKKLSGNTASSKTNK